MLRSFWDTISGAIAPEDLIQLPGFSAMSHAQIERLGILVGLLEQRLGGEGQINGFPVGRVREQLSAYLAQRDNGYSSMDDVSSGDDEFVEQPLPRIPAY